MNKIDLARAYRPALLLPVICVLSLAPAIAPTAAASKLSDAAIAPSAVSEAGASLRLAHFTFDPLRQLPQLPADLATSAAEANGAGVYILQFTGPVLPEWKKAVADAGVQLGDYIPDYAFLAHINGQDRTVIQSLPFVRWVGPYEPAYKMNPGDMANSPRSYRVVLAPWADKTATETALKAISHSVRASSDGYSAVLDGKQLPVVAHMADVVWVEPYYLQHLYNNVGGGTIMNGTQAWGAGYSGSGMTIAVADTGLDTGNPGAIHQDFSGRVAHISSWPVQPVDWGDGCTTANVGADDGAADKSSGHGTHVTGSVAGNGTASSGLYKSLAYAASITFQAIEQWTTWAAACSKLTSGYYLTGIPDDPGQLLNEAYGWGARVHNNSWGGGQAGVYDQQARYFDTFIHNHPDMAVVVAAGNNGTDANSNGYVDEGSIDSPGSSKNVLVVGASENERTSGGYNPGGICSTWGTCWPTDYPANPTHDDGISDNRGEMAAFSSRGPMNDGRIKPDVVAPGTNIISVRSSQASGTGWGAVNAYYMYDGGTSMASPLTAGAATLVREFYVENQGVANPSAALIKATLINTAVDIPGYGNTSYEAGQPIPNNHEGWGRVDVGAATNPGARQFVDDSSGVNTSVTRTYHYTVTASTKPFKVSLVWSDYPGAALAGVALVNDLNLQVIAPDGTVYRGNVFSGGWSQTGGNADNRNNVENVYVQTPATGQWTVQVTGANVPQGPQPFALVVDGNLYRPPLTPRAFVPVARAAGVEAPAAPVLNSINNNGAGSYTVSWAASAGATSYTLEESTSSSFTSPVTRYSGSNLSWQASGKAAGTYYYRVNALNAGGTSGWSNIESAVVTGPPAFPNGDFESGTSGWSEYSSNGWDIITNQFPTGIAPHGGSWAAWLGGDNDETSYIERQVTVPVGAGYLAYYHWPGSDELTCGYDFAYVRVNGINVETLNLCALTNTGGWVKHVVNLGTYAGQSVTLQIRVETDSNNPSSLLVDDLAWQTNSVITESSMPVVTTGGGAAVKGQTGTPR